MAWKLALVWTVLLAGTFVAATYKGVSAQAEEPTGGKKVVLVELFTSEGCSSCPPADTLLKTMEEKQAIEGVEVVALGMHVDYWDRLGWKDPFSAGAFTDRQRQYAERMRLNSVYTPQMVVQGTAEFVGSDAAAARRAVADAPAAEKLNVSAENLNADKLKVTVRRSNAAAGGAAAGGKGKLIIALTESGLSTEVKRGENGGRRLAHAPVVRRLLDAGKPNAEGLWSVDLKVEPGWTRAQLRLVAFVQDPESGTVEAIGTSALAAADPKR